MNIVVDASAVLALLQGETLPDVHVSRIPGATISSLNLCEVVTKLTFAGLDETAVRKALKPLGFDVVTFDEERAIRAGRLIGVTSSFGLSMGDRACVALGQELGWSILTADRAWSNLRSVGFDIVLIR